MQFVRTVVNTYYCPDVEVEHSFVLRCTYQSIGKPKKLCTYQFITGFFLQSLTQNGRVVYTCVAFSHKSEKSCIIIDAVVGLQGSWLSRSSPYIEFKVAFRKSFSFLTGIELKEKEVLANTEMLK